MYKLLKPILFAFSAETAHNFIVALLLFLRYIPFSGFIFRLFYKYSDKKLEREVFGIKFPNPVGLAAGMDKNGELYNEFANIGFGFVEIGSLTHAAQPGNPKPRCFRLIDNKAIINRMGINNKGARHAVDHLNRKKKKIIVGANISKNSSSSNENAASDYEKAFAILYDYVDYFVINISCPNVKGITKLQDIDSLSKIVNKLIVLRRYYDEYKPILLKVSPDLTFVQLDQIITLTISAGVDGIVATNTTVSREGLITSKSRIEAIGDGGLSGKPLFNRSFEVVKYISGKTGGSLPIIACGGIMTPKEAKMMLEAGASLVQIYTGFIYNGPGIVRKILKYISKNNG